MDPCPFVRILIGNLALKFPVSSSKPSLSRIHPSTTPCYCKIKLKKFPDQLATIPLIQHESEDQKEPFSTSNPISLAACFSLNKAQVDKFVEKWVQSEKEPTLVIDVYSAPDGVSCGMASGKCLGKVYVPLDLRGAENRASVVHNGWVALGASKKGSCAQLHFSIKVEPDPRFVFQFAEALKTGGIIKALCVPSGAKSYSNTALKKGDIYNEAIKSGAKVIFKPTQ